MNDPRRLNEPARGPSPATLVVQSTGGFEYGSEGWSFGSERAVFPSILEMALCTAILS